MIIITDVELVEVDCIDTALEAWDRTVRVFRELTRKAEAG